MCKSILLLTKPNLQGKPYSRPNLYEHISLARTLFIFWGLLRYNPSILFKRIYSSSKMIKVSYSVKQTNHDSLVVADLTK
jgi:hypothetical protein